MGVTGCFLTHPPLIGSYACPLQGHSLRQQSWSSIWGLAGLMLPLVQPVLVAYLLVPCCCSTALKTGTVLPAEGVRSCFSSCAVVSASHVQQQRSQVAFLQGMPVPFVLVVPLHLVLASQPPPAPLQALPLQASGPVVAAYTCLALFRASVCWRALLALLQQFVQKLFLMHV